MANIPWPTPNSPRLGTRVEYAVSTSTSTVILAAAAGKKARVLRGWLQNLDASNAVVVKFKDESGDISQDVTIPAGGTFSFGHDAQPADHWESNNANSALSIEQTGAYSVKGEVRVEYWSR